MNIKSSDEVSKESFVKFAKGNVGLAMRIYNVLKKSDIFTEQENPLLPESIYKFYTQDKIKLERTPNIGSLGINAINLYLQSVGLVDVPHSCFYLPDVSNQNKYRFFENGLIIDKYSNEIEVRTIGIEREKNGIITNPKLVFGFKYNPKTQIVTNIKKSSISKIIYQTR